MVKPHVKCFIKHTTMDPVAEYRVLDVSSKRGRPKLYYNL